MSELKAYQVDAFIQKKPTQSGVYLVYGPDAGLVYERSHALCTGAGEQTSNDVGFSKNITVLQLDELESDRSKLSVEARTHSMFDGTPVIRIRNATKTLAPILQDLLEQNFQAFIVIEAGSLTKRDALRVLIEKADNGWTLPSFADNNNSLKSLITQFFVQEDVSITPDAIEYLCSILGNDREISRRELEKLASFAYETKELTQNDIQALCGDNSMLAVDSLIDALSLGQPVELEKMLNRFFRAGLDCQTLLISTARHFSFLHTIHAKIAKGMNINSALANTYPRVHFSRKQAINTQIQIWSLPTIKRASKRIFNATLQTRQQPVLSETITRRALLGICLSASPR